MRRHLPGLWLGDHRSFNSRTPGGVRLRSSYLRRQASPVSIHAPREGCDHRVGRSLTKTAKFQFTHPGRGATLAVMLADVAMMFQFTHPGRGATKTQLRQAVRTRRFNSRTPGGVRPILGYAPRYCEYVSIHAPREGCDNSYGYYPALPSCFNSRTPGGVRLSAFKIPPS